MPGPPMLQGPFRVPSFNGYIPRRMPLLPVLVQGAPSEIYPTAHDRRGNVVCYPVMMYFLIGIGVLIIFLLWDIQPIRSTLKKMPAWNFVGRKMKKNLA